MVVGPLLYWIHPWWLTWNPKMMVSKRNLLFQGSIFRFYVNFPGRIGLCSDYNTPYSCKISLIVPQCWFRLVNYAKTMKLWKTHTNTNLETLPCWWKAGECCEMLLRIGSDGLMLVAVGEQTWKPLPSHTSRSKWQKQHGNQKSCRFWSSNCSISQWQHRNWFVFCLIKLL